MKLISRVAFLVVVAIGCVGVTDTYRAPFRTEVTGTMRDASGAPVPNTHFHFLTRGPDGQFSLTLPIRSYLPSTNADGSFTAMAASLNEGVHDVRVAVYLGAATVLVDVGKVTFSSADPSGQPPARIDIDLPP